MDCESFFELLKSRRSIRQFTERKPSRTQIECLIEAASWAPSNHNRQGWKFIVFEDRQQIRILAEQTRKSLRKTMKEDCRLTADQADELVHLAGAFDQSPIVILAMHKKSPAVGRSLLACATSELASGEALSTAMAVQNLLLAAHAIGLGDMRDDRSVTGRRSLEIAARPSCRLRTHVLNNRRISSECA